MRTMRYILCLIPLYFLFIIGYAEVAEARDIAVDALIESGPDLELSVLHDPVIISNGRVLLPLREVGDKLSLNIYWDQATRTASLYGVNKEIKITIGSNEAFVNDQKISLDVGAKLINGRTYIPLRFIADATGESVSWNASTKMLTMSRSYAIGTGDGLTYWIHLKTGTVSKAGAREPGVTIGKLDNPSLSVLKEINVIKLSPHSSYIYYNQSSGPSGTVRISGQALIKDDKIIDQARVYVMGYYLVTNLSKAQDVVLISDGKMAKFLDAQGQVTSSYSLTDIMGKDEVYMIEYYDSDFLMLREYNSQHLIAYDLHTKKVIYVHEAIDLPEQEKEFLIQAGLDRPNEMEYDHIITFDRVENKNTLWFKYKHKQTDEVHAYKLTLDEAATN